MCLKYLCFIASLLQITHSLPEQGLWNISKREVPLFKRVFMNTTVSIRNNFTCHEDGDYVFNVHAVSSRCMDQMCESSTAPCPSEAQPESFDCSFSITCKAKDHHQLINVTECSKVRWKGPPAPQTTPTPTTTTTTPKPPKSINPNVTTTPDNNRRKRQVNETDSKQQPKTVTQTGSDQQSDSVTPSKIESTVILKAPYDGSLRVVISLQTDGRDKSSEKYLGWIETKDTADHYLSAVDLPNLYFYMVLIIIYTLCTLFWLIMMCCYCKDLLRVQYLLLVVIVLGLLESITYYSEYRNVDQTGVPNKTMVIMAEFMATCRRTSSRALLIVVSVGFGIVKPRLGPTLPKLLALSLVYFISACVEWTVRSLSEPDKQDVNNTSMLFLIPYALCEAAFVYWIFHSLLQTIRALRLRRNVVKLQLYRHFTYLIIFAVLASLGFLAWDLSMFKFNNRCKSALREFWLIDGFADILFGVILFVICILWRPSLNNHRFAKGILIDQADDEEEETLMMTDAFESKKRNKNGMKKKERKSREDKVEEDLQWIEDNIPASLADAAPGIIADSEEEIMTTRIELSKMD